MRAQLFESAPKERIERNKALQSQDRLNGRKKPRMRPKAYCFNLQSEERERRIPSPLNSMDTSYTGRVSRVVELLQGKWTVQILCAMRTRPVRLSELKRAIPPASKKALTASLRSLEAARVVLRRDLSSSVLHVEYELADARTPRHAVRSPCGMGYTLRFRRTVNDVLLSDQIRVS